MGGSDRSGPDRRSDHTGDHPGDDAPTRWLRLNLDDPADERPVDEEKRPVDGKKRPVDEEKRPVDEEKRPVDGKKRPVDETTRTDERKRDERRGSAVAAGRTRGPREWVAIGSFVVGAVTVATFFAIGAWQRRWIADDGLIVLRTLRNLFAGNGPVFNAGERVEANTSTAWTYLLWFWAWVTDGQLEYVALWVALVLSVAAIPIAMYGTARLLRNRIGGVTGDGYTLLLPLGAIVYIAVPPARDFATSGLENGLCIFWAAVLWCLLVSWSRRANGADATRGGAAATLFLAFWAGLAPLVRPELAVVGGIALVLVFLAPLSWKMRVGVVVVAAVLPVGYQIFRMGYYALLVPNPAVAKDASGSKWGQGFTYLANLFGPYTLLLPVILAVVAGVLMLIGARLRRLAPAPAPAGDSASVDTASGDAPTSRRDRLAGWSRALQTPTAVTVAILLAGAIVFVYWLRQGGDFMHGRVLLTPLFVLLLPLMVIPVTIPVHGVVAAFRRTPAAASTDDANTGENTGEAINGGVSADDAPEGTDPSAGIPTTETPVPGVPAADVPDASTRNRRTRLQLAGSVIMAGLWVTTVVWAAMVHETVLPNAGIDIGRSGIVDERRFYVTNMGNENPVTAADYLDYPRMQAMVDNIAEHEKEGGVLVASFNYDEWYYIPLPQSTPQDKRTLTVYFLNLGMTSMNAPLDVRVVDQMGLAYPLAAHTERLEDGRIGHDKVLPTEWVVAESGAVPRRPVLPGFLDEDTVRQAQVALTCPDTRDRFASFEGTWTWQRFKSNLKQSFGFNNYRIERNPEYEIQRCGLTMPQRINPR
ncbi:glycosyltransferase family 39 protein [Gordonia desulfuricans]|uniref:Glycosyltransferase family 39 protein n=1 Tax=Gordonia desulfuricans TaxID=89051 RepID=A0A7K3LVW1_9ACTN|nr:glycosyltransferase family 39 protein [Gordonia desulfuricans]